MGARAAGRRPDRGTGDGQGQEQGGKAADGRRQGDGAGAQAGPLKGAAAAEPEYHTVLDHRGTPFGPGAPISYRKGSALHRALAIFRDHSRPPLTRARFMACGDDPRDLDRLIAAGQVVHFRG